MEKIEYVCTKTAREQFKSGKPPCFGKVNGCACGKKPSKVMKKAKVEKTTEIIKENV